MDNSTTQMLPIVAHHESRATPAMVGRAEDLADELTRENRRLLVPDALRALIPAALVPQPALHIDDLSRIPLLSRFNDVTQLEERARLRAVDGDLVASCTPSYASYEQYCREALGLGDVQWLYPTPRGSPLATAAACWNDRAVRKTIRRTANASDLFYIHPHQGVFPVWALAVLLERSCHTSVKVIAPHPALCDAVNDKVWFTMVAQRLFGAASTPRSATAWNLSGAAKIAKVLASSASVIVVKIPASAGGAGNILFSADEILRHSIGTVRKLVRERLNAIGWDGTAKFLVSAWETDVLSTPSSQLWIPPEAEGSPIVEAVLEQLIEGTEGIWCGSRPPTFSEDVLQQVVDVSWLMARLFQRLGYVGRCSFDLLLIGKSFDLCRPEFVECNGRWGGASVPMTLMNRLFGDWKTRPYLHRDCTADGLHDLTFDHLQSYFAADLFDVRTGRGNLIFLNPTGLRESSSIDVVTIGKTMDEAIDIADTMPVRLRKCVASVGGSRNRVA